MVPSPLPSRTAFAGALASLAALPPAPSEPEGGLGVLLLQMGGPTSLEEVEPFLAALLSDPAMVQLPRLLRPFQRCLMARAARKRAVRTRRWYEQMGGGSPLVATTDSLAAKLQARLREGGREGASAGRSPDSGGFKGVAVQAAYRYSQPDAAEALARLRQAGARRLLLLSLYPHYSHTTTGSSLGAVREALEVDDHWREPPVMVEAWPDHPGYLDLLEAQVREGLTELGLPERPDEGEVSEVALLCSAHGLPVSYIRAGDPYYGQLKSTFEALRERLAPLECYLGFQSRLGRREWLGPGSLQVIEKLAAEGRCRLVVLPLGFVCEHIETLYEMDILLRAQADKVGLETFHRIPAFDDQKPFVELLATMINQTLGPPLPTGAEEGEAPG